MIFPDIQWESNKFLKLNRDDVITFQVIPTSPVEIREHFIKTEDGKMKVEPCIGERCDYCATYRVLAKTAVKECRDFAVHKRYHLPVVVDKNDCGIEPDEYIFRFSNQIHRAYNQLIFETSNGFNSRMKLLFTHRVKMKHDWPDYSFCLFSFGGKSKTVDRLDRVSGSHIFFA